jgi:signal transduction histidine kinase/CheY-like chemotaxis protein
MVLREGHNAPGSNPHSEVGIRAEMDQVRLEGARWVAGTLAFVMAAFIVYDSQRNLGDGLTGVIFYDVVSLLIGAGLFVALKRRMVPPRMGNGVIFLACVTVIPGILFTATVTGDPFDLIYLPLLMIGAGAIMLSMRWFIGFAIVSFITSAFACFDSLPQTDFVNLMVSLLVTASIALAIQHSRLRAHRRMAKLNLDLVERFEQHKREENRRKQLEEELQQAQKMEAIGLLAGGVAHDMNNVLGAIISVASVLKEDVSHIDSAKRDTVEILQAAQRGGELTSNLLGFARKGKYRKEAVSLNDASQQVVQLLDRILPKKVSLVSEFDNTIPLVQGDPGQLGQVIMNLCVNAADALGSAGRITLVTRSYRITEDAPPAILQFQSERCVELVVRDDGTGMEKSTIDRAFEPFFTTKPVGKGSGLGLSMVYGTVQNHGGVVTIDSKQGAGTAVTVSIPACEESMEVAPMRASVAATPEVGRGVVLLVDDESMIRKSGKRLLQSLGLEVLCASDGKEGLEEYQREGERIELVLLDMAMPVMDGAECFWRLREIDPGVTVIISSGYACGEEVEEMLASGGVLFLGKPYEKETLQKAVVRALDMPKPKGTTGSQFG